MSGPRLQPRPNRIDAQRKAQDAARRAATYDAYPDSLVRPPRVQLFLVALEDGESFDGERVDTDELSAREFIPLLETDKRRRWLASRIVAAHARLVDRIGPTEADEPPGPGAAGDS